MPVEHAPADLQYGCEIGDLERELDRLLGKQDRQPFAVQPGKGLVHRFDDRGRKAERRLVQHQELWIAHQGAADRQHLPLASGHGAGALAAPFLQPRKDFIDALQQGGRALPVAQRRGAEQQIVLDALLHEQPPAFRRQREPFSHDRKRAVPCDLLPAKFDAARMHRDQAGNRIQRRGLAAAVGAQ